MEIGKKLQVIYLPGTWGNTVRWMLDRFYKDSNFTHLDSPWDKDSRTHGFGQTQYNKKFFRGLPVTGSVFDPDPEADKILISFNPNDHVFIERCAFYRIPGMETEQNRHASLISSADPAFVKTQFNGATQSKSVAKELMKIRFYDIELHTWYNGMKDMMKLKEYYKFDINALSDYGKLITELSAISKRFDLHLDIDDAVIRNVVDVIKNQLVVLTKDRHKEILKAIRSGENLKCSECDIIEQAYIEVELEKQHGLIFPYGTNWFNDTSQINDFIQTYPKYLRDNDRKLPWHERVKIDKQN